MSAASLHPAGSAHHHYHSSSSSGRLSPTGSSSDGSSRTTTPTSPSFLTTATTGRPSGGSNGSIHMNLTNSNSSGPPTASSSSSGSGVTTESVNSWSHKEVGDFLTSVKCAHLIPTFTQNDITGRVIMDLTMQSMKEMGVERVGDRVRVQGGLNALKAKQKESSSGFSGRRPTVVITRGDDLFSQLGISAIGVSNRTSSTTFNGPSSITFPTLPRATQTTQHQPLSSFSPQLQPTTSNHRPTPLRLNDEAISSAHLPQAYQTASTTASSISSAGSSSNKLSPSSRPLPLGPVPPPKPLPAGTQPQTALPRLPPPRETSLRAPGSTTAPVGLSSRRVGTGNSTSPAPVEPGPFNQSRGTVLPPSAPLPPAPHHSFTQTSPIGGHKTSGSMSGGSFTERRAHLARERGNTAPPNTTSSSAGIQPPPRFGTGSSFDPRKDFLSSNGSLATPTVTSTSNGRPSTSTGVNHPFALSSAASAISPSYQQLSNPPVSSPSDSASTVRSKDIGYTVGRGPFQHSSSASSISTIPTSTGGQSLSAEAIRRKCLKFINSEDGHSRVIDLGECDSGVEMLEKALRKFGKNVISGGSGISESEESDLEDLEDERGLSVDGWGLYFEGEKGDHGNNHLLTEAELLALIHAPADAPARQKGLTIRRIKKNLNRKAMEQFFGETPPAPMSPTSPTYYAAPRIAANDDAGDLNRILTPSRMGANQGGKKMNRASTVSVMSGLGVPLGPDPSVGLVLNNNPNKINNPQYTRSPSTGNFLQRGKKMYNFFGHRPPSELITNHLGEYFPKVQRKVLERTARNSAMRISSGSGIGLDPTRPTPSTSWSDDKDGGAEALIRQPRSSTSSGLSQSSSFGSPKRKRTSPLNNGTSPAKSAIPEDPELSNEDENIPRVSISTDAGEEISESESSDAGSIASRPPLLPPFVPSTDSLFPDSLKILGDSPRRSSVASNSRMSILSQFRRARDTSDTASMMTVDEITAHVENRRKSHLSFHDGGDDADEDEDDDGILTPYSGRASITGSADTAEPEDYDEDDEDDRDYDEDEDDVNDDDEDDDVGKAMMSTGGKGSIKWIKGALIGSGSFGSVFLGMDAKSGLLMAVKQVELPNGVSNNQERKQSMFSALETEIELLKELQHENIVQYLDSAMDDAHLNIFLEYVPGGSVSALLRNYGAFEEDLVRRFIRQTLQGLEYLHARGIIHRDIKGANILVDNKGGIKISDFGISRRVGNDLYTNQRKSLQGTVFWMAPEVVKQTAHTPFADIWSVGCLVVEMLTGQRPWGRLDQMQVMFKIGSACRPDYPPDITTEAEEFLNNTFVMDYEKRPTAAACLLSPFLIA